LRRLIEYREIAGVSNIIVSFCLKGKLLFICRGFFVLKVGSGWNLFFVGVISFWVSRLTLFVEFSDNPNFPSLSADGRSLLHQLPSQLSQASHPERNFVAAYTALR